MNLALTSRRLWLAVVFSPLVLPLVSSPIAVYYQFRLKPDTSLTDVWNYLYIYVEEFWYILVIAYIVHITLLLPFIFIAKHFHKLKLIIFLPGAYIIGSIGTLVSLAVISPFKFALMMIPGLVSLSLLTGGTYGFYQGYLFWYMAGLHQMNKEARYADQY